MPNEKGEQPKIYSFNLRRELGAKEDPRPTDEIAADIVKKYGEDLAVLAKLTTMGTDLDRFNTPEDIEGEQNRKTLLEGLDPQIIELARMKAEQIVARASDIEHISALARINTVISGKTPREMIEALDDVILASAGKSQLAPEIELALAFLAITDNKPNETQ